MSAKLLPFSDDLALPLDAATQTFAFIARKGAGKTYAAGKLTELLLDAGVQTVILDTVGNWYGLRLAADGKGDGFDIPVLGGLRGDIPLGAHAGELVADLVVDTGRSVIVDLSQFSLADRKRFATAFAVRLWQRKKAELDPTPLFLVIEEAQLIIPQFVGKDDARMVGIYEEIVRLGRNYGIGVGMISQRPQSVNNEALTQVECLVALQVNGVPERKTLRDWMVHHGGDVDLIKELPSLPVGTAYVWSPQWLRVLKKVRIAPKKTFDASATPKVGERRQRREPKPLDLAALQERMASLIEEAKASDPTALKRRIAELEKQLRERPAAAPVPAQVERVEVRVPDGRVLAQVARLGPLADRLDGVAHELEDVAHAIGDVVRAIATLPAIDARVTEVVAKVKAAAPPPAARRDGLQRESKPTVTPKAAPPVNRGPGVTAPQQRILDALASFEALGIRDVARGNVAVFADQSSKSSGFANNLGALRGRGLIEYPGSSRVCLTDAGRAVATPATPITSSAQLHEAWYAKLPRPQATILRVLVEQYPGSIDRDTLASLAEQSPTSSGYANNLGALRSLGLAEYPVRGYVVATGLLFPEGVPA